MFEKELDFFKAHQAELVSKHGGAILLLRGESVVGVYRSALEAYLDGEKKFGLGSFMIQPCEPGPGAYTVTISSTNF